VDHVIASEHSAEQTAFRQREKADRRMDSEENQCQVQDAALFGIGNE